VSGDVTQLIEEERINSLKVSPTCTAWRQSWTAPCKLYSRYELSLISWCRE
jgi:hypothetical protein